MQKENYSFFNLGLFCLAITLICIASIFIKKSLSINAIAIEEKVFDVYIAEPMFKNKTATSLITTDNRIDISLNLNNFDSDSSFITNINNAGDFDSVISSITKTNLSNFIVGDINGKSITLADYIDFSIINMDENDVVKAHSNTDIEVVLKKKIVSSEYEELLNNSPYKENINIELFINVDFQQV